MEAVLLTIGGAILGVLLTVLYEKTGNKKTSSEIRTRLGLEIGENIEALKGVLEAIDDLSTNKPNPYVESISIEEIAARIERACRRETFDAYYRDLPGLGSKAMEEVVSFYDGFRRVPDSFREIERYAGNIRAGLFEDNIQYLMSKGENAIKAIER